MSAPEELKVTHCNLLKFGCDQQWHALTETGDPRVRFCERCREPVHFCSSQAEFQHHAAQHHCVAFAASASPETAPWSRFLIGEADPEGVFLD